MCIAVARMVYIIMAYIVTPHATLSFCVAFEPKDSYIFARESQKSRKPKEPKAKRALWALWLRSQKTWIWVHKNLMRAKTELVFMSQVVAPLLSKIIAIFWPNTKTSGWRLGSSPVLEISIITSTVGSLASKSASRTAAKTLVCTRAVLARIGSFCWPT